MALQEDKATGREADEKIYAHVYRAVDGALYVGERVSM